MRNSVALSAALFVLTFTASACGGGGGGEPAASGAAPSAAPSSAASPSAVALTEADLKETTVTAAEIGKGWEATSGGAGPVPVSPTACPQPSRSTTALESTAQTWQGFRSTTAGVTVALTARAGEDAADYKAAYAADLAKCKKYAMKSGKDKFEVVDKAEGPGEVAGADEVLGSSVRRFYLDVEGKPLVQAIQTLVCRKGSMIVEVGYGPYGKTTDETAKRVKDFTAATKLMQTQLEKIEQ